MKEELEEVFSKHEQITKELWILMIVVLSLFGNSKTTNIEELDNLLARLKEGDTDLLKEVIINEQSTGYIKNDKKS